MEARKSNVPKLRFPEFNGAWEEKRLGELASKPSYGMNAAATSFDGKHKYIRITDISDDLNAFEPNPLTSPKPPIADEYRLKNGDLLFARTGASTGKSYLYDPNDGELFFAGFLIRFSITKANPSFVFAQTQRPSFLRWINLTSMRSGQPGINAQEYAAFKFEAPTLPEQKKIADFLGAVDDKIAQLTRKKELLETYKKGVSQQLFSQHIRFKQDDGQDFPDWEVAPFGELVERVKTKFDPRKSDDQPIVVELENLETGTGKIMGQLALSEQKSLMTVFASGDVLFGKLRPYLRKFAHPKFDGICSSEIWALRGKSISNDFMFQMIQGTQFTQLANISTGSKMPRADWQTIADSEFEIPHPDEQRKIADFLSAIDTKIDLAVQELAQAKTFKKGLLQQMFV